MNLDTIFYKGCVDKPAVIFIHGLGMDKDIWVNPSNSYILGGRFPIKSILGKRPSAKDFGLFRDMPGENVPKFSTGEQPGNIQTLFDDLRFKGYTVITWSQERPAGPIESVDLELKEIVKILKKMTKAGIILIGHSRGGLIGRKHLLKKDRAIRGLITISTPHKGSSIARIANYLSPLVSLIKPLFTGSNKGTLSFAIKRIFEFLKSKALKELLPESNFFKSLKDGPSDRVHYISVGGTNPTLFRFYRWKWNPVREGEFQRWFLMPEELFSIPDIFGKVIPENLYPEEMKKGKGDGLVSAESSNIPWYNVHYNFELNHAEVLFDEGVRNMLLKEIERIS
jgi:pimeloyl-ACP methyl ester carboxylesterase